MSIARALLTALRDELRADPSLAGELRELLGVSPAPKEPSAIYMRAAEYAARVSMSPRTVWTLIGRGLPTVGAGKSRRIDVARADEWLREQSSDVDDAVEKQARRSARRAAGRGVQ